MSVASCQLAFTIRTTTLHADFIAYMVEQRTTNEMWNANVNTPSTHKYCISFTCWYRYHLYNRLPFTKRSKNKKNIGIFDWDDVEKRIFGFHHHHFSQTQWRNDNVDCYLWYSILCWIQYWREWWWWRLWWWWKNKGKLNKKGSYSCEHKWWHSQFISISHKMT